MTERERAFATRYPKIHLLAERNSLVAVMVKSYVSREKEEEAMLDDLVASLVRQHDRLLETYTDLLNTTEPSKTRGIITDSKEFRLTR